MATPKTALSLWIKAERDARQWKSEELARRLREAGYRAEDATVRAWEANRKPGADALVAMERLFGSPAPVDRAADMTGLVEAIRELVVELRLTREEQARWNRGVEDTLAAVLADRTLATPTGAPAARTPSTALRGPGR